MQTVEEMLRDVLSVAYETENEGLLTIADAFEDTDASYRARPTGKNRAAAHQAHKALRQAWLTNCKG